MNLPTTFQIGCDLCKFMNEDSYQISYVSKFPIEICYKLHSLFFATNNESKPHQLSLSLVYLFQEQDNILASKIFILNNYLFQ